jgi:NTE family protein
MGNPVLFPLIDESFPHDLVILQINPLVRPGVPRTAAEISNRLNEITFNASLVREISSILLLKRLIDEENPAHVRYAGTRLHRISADDAVLQLGVASKLNVEWAFLSHLHDVGYAAADRWIERNIELVGHCSTIDAGLP